jgi:zinc protease
MARTQETPSSRLTQLVNQLSYRVHPYGRPLLGTASTVSAMTRDTVQAFYNTYYAPNNMTLVLSGHLTPAQGRAMAEKYFGAWPSKQVPDDNVTQEPPQTQIRTQTIIGTGTSAYLMFGFHAPAVSNERDAYTMDVLLTLLGLGGNNRLDTVLRRQKKLVTSVSSNYLTQKDPGMLTILTESDPSQMNAAHDAVLAEIAKLRTLPVSNDELNAAKHTLLANYLFDAQTTSGRANAMGFYNSIDTYKYDVNYISNFESVTPLELQRVAQQYLNPSAYTLVISAPRINPEVSSGLSISGTNMRLAEGEEK